MSDIVLPQKVLHLQLEEAKKKTLIGTPSCPQYMVTEKFDGIYCFIDIIEGVPQQITSRQLRPTPALQFYNNSFYSFPAPYKKTRLIMEAVIPGINFHIANGIMNRSIGNPAAEKVIFHIHDMLNLEDFYIKRYSNMAIERYCKLFNCFNSFWKDNIKIIYTLNCSSDKEIWLEEAKTIWEKGGEGVVLKRSDSFYAPDKRNADLLKIKLEEKLILECVELYYTIGEKGNSNLNIICREEGKKEEIHVRVGKHSDIKKIEEDKNYILGKNVEIICMQKLPSGQLREPRFKRIVE